MVFSPDGKLLAVAGGSPGRLGELQVWDAEKRALKYALAVTFDTIYIWLRARSERWLK